MSLFERLRMHAVAQPRRVALEWPGGSMDYADLLAEVGAATQWLWESGLEVIALDLDNEPAWVVIDIAAMQLGICLVPLPPFFSTAQRDHALRSAAVQAVIGVDDATPPADPETPGGFTAAGRRLAVTLVDAGHHRQPARRAPGEVHKITFTSGTTAEPKGVMLSWPGIRPVVASLVDAVGLHAGDRHLLLMPLAVLLENIGGLYAPLWAGATVVLWPLAEVGLRGSSGLDSRRMVEVLHTTAASTAIFTPQTLQGAVEVLEARPDTGLALCFAAVGGAPLSARLLQRAEHVGLPVYEGYGLSECASVVCLNTPAQHRPGSVGRPLPHARLRIGADGEVLVADPAFGGYLGQPAAPAGEWPTGDLGELDDDGYLYLRGRRRNIFITAFGRNVAPEWVERELGLEPAILQSAVFGEARPYNVALIVVREGAAAVDVEAAVARVNQTLPDYARVARWLVAEAPFSPDNGLLTGTGRIRRDAVRARYHRDIESLYREVRTS